MTLAILALATLSVIPAPRAVRYLGGRGQFSEEMIRQAVANFSADKTISPEGYRMEIDENGVSVWASTESGAFYAGQTLRQLLRPDGTMDYVSISDAPEFSWRGIHLDVARHFFGKDVIIRLLEQMAQFKLNVLHLHLTDDQGWRIPVPGFPKLTEATRPVENRRNFRDLSAEGVYGPFAYTVDELKEVVRRASELHIAIVPEVEIPGHSRLLLQNYPDFACAVTNRLVDNVACVGKLRTLEFFERTLDVVCEIFPGPVVHIGGDECDRRDWMKCPDCLSRMRKESIDEVAALQAWVTAHFEKYLASKGKRLMGWDEIAEGGLPESSMVMSWRGTSTGVVAARKNHDVVMCPNDFCYFDYEQCVEDDPVPYMIDWTVPVPWTKTYSFDPYKGVPLSNRRHILGAQGNNWTEKTCTEAELQWKLWPRAIAMAEVLWTNPAKRDVREFAQRLRTCRASLVASGVNAAPVDFGRKGTAAGRLLYPQGKDGNQLVYQCGMMRADLAIENGELSVKVNGNELRSYKKDSEFCVLEVTELEPSAYLVTARRKSSEIVVVIVLVGERVSIRDRWDGEG